MKRLSALILLAALLLTLLPAAGAFADTTTAKLEQVLDDALLWLKAQTTPPTLLTYLALYAAGEEVSALAVPELGLLEQGIVALLRGENPHTAGPHFAASLQNLLYEDGCVGDNASQQLLGRLFLPSLIPPRYIDRAGNEAWLVTLLGESETYRAIFGMESYEATLWAAYMLPTTYTQDIAGELSVSFYDPAGTLADAKMQNAGALLAYLCLADKAGFTLSAVYTDAFFAYQNEDGSFSATQGGPADYAVTCKVVLALSVRLHDALNRSRLPAVYFTDLGTIQPGMAAHVNSAVQKGLMSGSGSQQFRPLGVFSRAEMAAVLRNMVNLPAADSTAYADVSASDWFFSSVAAVEAAGLMNDREGGFRPHESVTRGELCVYLTGVLQLDSTEAMAALNAGTLVIADRADITAELLPYVATIMYEGIMVGYQNVFRANDNITRQEVAAVLNKMYS